jgi:magnesium-dependent phosphatase 1
LFLCNKLNINIKIKIPTKLTIYSGRIKDNDGNEYELYPEVLDILSELKKKNYTLAIASRIEDISTAYLLLIYFNISDFFKFKEIYPGSKIIHFKW